MSNVRQRRPIKEQGGPSTSAAAQGDETTDWTSLAVKIGIGLVIGLPLLAYLVLELFIPCPIEPQPHTFDPIPPFVGPLAPNSKLSSIEKLFPGEFRGPESMTFYNGKVYSGVADGRIVEIDLKTMEYRNLVETLGRPPCGSIMNEPNCGRPLGLRAKDGFIFVVDAWLGLFKVNIETGAVENLFPASMKMPDGFEPKFLNDVEIGSDGVIYVTDSSSKWGRSNHPYVGFENRPDGRLISFDPRTNDTRILARDLYFANGLQLADDDSFILITEMSRCRVTKYYLKGPRKGEREIFSDNLPGLPDNIRPSSKGGYWVALAVVRHPTMWSVWDSTAPYPWLKRIMAKVFHKFSIGRMVPKYGLVLELNKDGEIVGSLHDQTGTTMPAVSEVREEEGILYFGSYFLPFLGRLDLRGDQY